MEKHTESLLSTQEPTRPNTANFGAQNRRAKCLRKLEELRALRDSLTPFAIKAADRSEITLTYCPPLEAGSYSLTDDDARILTLYLGACLEVAKCEQRLAALEEGA